MASSSLPDHRTTQVAVGLAVAQVIDAVGGSLMPRRYIESHLDHLGVATRLRSALGPTKIAASVGLVGA